MTTVATPNHSALGLKAMRIHHNIKCKTQDCPTKWYRVLRQLASGALWVRLACGHERAVTLGGSEPIESEPIGG